MSKYEIQILGKPALLQKSISVEKGDESIEQLVNAMWEIMGKLNGVGLAAPQIGVNKRVIVFGFTHNKRYPHEEKIENTVLINPEYEVLSESSVLDWEGCLSVSYLRGKVQRYDHIKYWGYDTHWNKVEKIARGFHARIIQHEVDHLDGILFPFRIGNFRHLSYESLLLEKSD